MSPTAVAANQGLVCGALAASCRSASSSTESTARTATAASSQYPRKSAWIRCIGGAYGILLGPGIILENDARIIPGDEFGSDEMAT